MQPPQVRSSVKIRFKTAEEAAIVARALKPDDKPLPEGLEVETTHRGSEIIVEISCSRGLPSFLATVDDILRMAAVSEKVLRTSREKHTDI
ncbi:MAG: KEOPS complex subunit Pcc1 [Candidatus Caldarchaeum sp.]|nr:KEOPS complex subunit Pcc1 [Candidatus Caldarchaeum sp.]